MNLVFISPNFPTYYWNFCKSLRERGVTVLGIGDAPYDDLVSETRESLVCLLYTSPSPRDTR